MHLTSLTAISPIDGRYGNTTLQLRSIFSEYGLLRRRIQIEIQWLQVLSQHADIPEIPTLDKQHQTLLNSIWQDFSETDAERIKEIERTTKHDIKAVEYFIREKISHNKTLVHISEFVHFACTSEDINNLAHALMLKQSHDTVIRPALNDLLKSIQTMAVQYADQPMVSRTHGQIASPTTMGKEMHVFSYRIERQLLQLDTISFLGKINGAVGNFNAHLSACPNIDWSKVAKNFVRQFGLGWAEHTTQIESHDYMAEYFQAISRINTILINFCQDIWGYISLDYFKQVNRSAEVGSSTMPHKINPIDFERAEGNLGISNCLLIHLAKKLPISRWQRDLTDSTSIRNNGVAIAHALIAYTGCIEGIQKLSINPNKLESDLADAWAVLAEPIQTTMRLYGIDQAYEKLKALTRNQTINAEILHDFIQLLDIPQTAKDHLLNLTPATYIGNASQQAKSFTQKDQHGKSK